MRVVRVLHVFDSLGVGGAETWLMALLRYFRESTDLPVRVETDVLLTSGRQRCFDPEAVRLGATLHYVRYGIRQLVRFTRRFRRILVEGCYDAIHDHQGYAAGIHFLVGAGVLPPIRIAHVHNALFHIPGVTTTPRAVLRRIIGMGGISALGTHVMGTSRQLVTEYGFDRSAFRHLRVGAAYCGIDVDRFSAPPRPARGKVRGELGWNNQAKILLFVGRLGSDDHEWLSRRQNQKNPGFALDVARVCIQRNPAVRLVLAGAGECRKRELELQAQRWNLRHAIRFLGVRSDIPRLMHAADLLLFPSVAEGLGVVTVEAQAAGLSVLASDAVPRECVVVPGMVRFLPLSAGAESWADVALKMMDRRRKCPEDCNRAVRTSPFGIRQSALFLLSLYTRACTHGTR